jgi:hypothetical protein
VPAGTITDEPEAKEPVGKVPSWKGAAFEPVIKNNWYVVRSAMEGAVPSSVQVIVRADATGYVRPPPGTENCGMASAKGSELSRLKNAVEGRIVMYWFVSAKRATLKGCVCEADVEVG